MKIVHFGDEQPQRGASSALGDRYLATRSHVAKARPCLVFFFPVSFILLTQLHTSLSQFIYNTSFFQTFLLYLSSSFSDWLDKGWTLKWGLQSVLRKETFLFNLLFIDLSFQICHSVNLEISFSFVFLSFSESGWSLVYKLTGASSPENISSPLLQDSSNQGSAFNKNLTERYRFWMPFLSWFMNADSLFVLLYP